MIGSTKTLAGLLNLPLRRQHSYAHLQCQQIAKAICKTFKDAQTGSMDSGAVVVGQVHPNSEAVEFYGFNQLVAVLQRHFTPNERLPEWAQSIARTYANILLTQHQRLVHYMTLIVTREARHLNHKPPVFKKHPQYFPQVMQDFVNEIPNGSSEAARFFRENPPDVEFGLYCRAIEHCFTGSFSGGFGGTPWRNIAKTLADYVEGKTTGEMLVDTAYTLAHNNGPMFNKEMYYSMYDPSLITLLDIQRSGQVCELLLDPQFNTVVVIPPTPRLDELRKLAAVTKIELTNSGIGDYLDWYQVEELGSVHKYPQFKIKQDKLHPKKAKPVNIGGQVMVANGEFEVLPGQKLTVYKRAA